MSKNRFSNFSRRSLFKAIGLLPFTFSLSGLLAARTRLEPTPEIPDDDDDDPTPSQTEGPYFKAKSPERRSLKEKTIVGAAFVASGRVLDSHGKPVAGALLDFWHCDAGGAYDNQGFRLRGHQYTDEKGKWELETIFPGEYPGRTRHIHVKVQSKGGRVLTTQLYFPGEPRNARDGIFDKRLVMKLSEKEGVKRGEFDFVLAL